MVRFVLACPHTVVSMILISIVRSRRYVSNCARILGNSVSWLFGDTITSWPDVWYDMEHPSSMVRKSMVCICAITLIRLIEAIIVRLCLWELIVLFSIPMLKRLPLIGGEPCVQIPSLIWTRLRIRSLGPVCYRVNIGKLVTIILSRNCTNFTFESKDCCRKNDASGITWFGPCITPNQNRANSLVIVTFTVQAVRSYSASDTGATPSDSNFRPLRGHSPLVHAEPVTSKRDCNHWHLRGGSRKVWGNTFRHVVSNFKLRSQRESTPKVRNKVGFGASHTGLQDLIKYGRYMGSEQSVTCQMCCEINSLWMSFRVQPVEKGATNSNEVGGAIIFQHPFRVEGSLYPTPMPKGGWCYETCSNKLIAVSPCGLHGRIISFAVKGGDTCE